MTTISHDLELIGQRAMAVLLRRIDGDAEPAGGLVPPEMKVGDFTAPLSMPSEGRPVSFGAGRGQRPVQAHSS